METKHFVGTPVLSGGKKFYPVYRQNMLGEEKRAGKDPVCAAYAESAYAVEYFEDRRSAESYVDAMIAQTEGV